MEFTSLYFFGIRYEKYEELRGDDERKNRKKEEEEEEDGG